MRRRTRAGGHSGGAEFTGGRRTTRAPGRTGAITGGLSLLVRFDGKSAVVLRSTVSSSPPDPARLARTASSAAARGPHDGGASENVVSFIGPRGQIGPTYGWPGDGHGYYDGRRGQDVGGAGGLRGLSHALPRHERILHLAVPADAEHLLFKRVDVGPPMAGSRATRARGSSAGPALREWPLALYELRPQPGGDGQALTGAESIAGVSLSGLLPQPLPSTPAVAARAADRGAGAGHIDSHETIVNRGSPAEHFNIVITGDGFTGNDLSTFDTRARAIAAGLLKMPPFNKVASLINVHLVRAVSRESGITKCPDGVGKVDTYYGVRGRWNNAPYAGYICTPYPERVYDAAERVAPIDRIHLIIVLANCGGDGGSGFPDLKMAFLTENTDEVETAVHESAHAFADLADEYITGCPAESGRTYENQATQADVDASRVWWTRLAKRSELQAGWFKAVDTPAHAAPARCKGMLGLFWGCQNIDLPPGSECDLKVDWRADPRGGHFYRSMERCIMRELKAPFCRVCAAVIERTIRAAAVAPRARKTVPRAVRPSPAPPLRLGGSAGRPSAPMRARGREA
jgi:IgA peptidase M64